MKIGDIVISGTNALHLDVLTFVGTASIAMKDNNCFYIAPKDRVVLLSDVLEVALKCKHLKQSEIKVGDSVIGIPLGISNHVCVGVVNNFEKGNYRIRDLRNKERNWWCNLVIKIQDLIDSILM